MITSIASIFATIIMVIQIGWKVFTLALQIIAAVFQFAVTLIGWSINITDFLFVWVRTFLVWVSGWLGPLGTSVAWALSWAEIQRALILAGSVAAVLWVTFSTILNDFFYLLVNPFFLNLFTNIGHLGYSLMVGLMLFVMDSIRRFTHGPSKKELHLISELQKNA